MDYKLEDLIDIPFFQDLLDKLNEISPFPSAIIDNEGKILTATAWQPICTKFHRINPQSEKECLVSDKYILEHIDEANPAVSYRCPHGMIDNAIPIIIGGRHLANFFTGQFFLEPPDLDFFKKQAVKFGFDETSYLEAVRKTPVWNDHQLKKYIEFIHPFVHSMAEMGLTRLQDLENKKVLQDSELRYRDLFETAPVMYVIAHNVNGQPVITDCNQKFLDTLGYKRKDVLGKELTDFYSADSKIEFLQNGGYERSTSGSSLAEERELVCKNGTLLTCLAWASPEKGPAGNVTGLRATYMDIGRRKETEQSFQDSELRYSATVDALDDGIHVVDKDLNVVLCNAAMSKWMQELGYSGILVGKNLFKVFTFLPEKVREEYLQVFHSGKTLVTEEISQVGGREIQTETRKIPVVEHGRVERIVTVVRDISERKRADQQLKLSENELKKAQSYAHVGSWVWEIKTGHLQWSDEMYNIFGISKENFSGKLEDVVANAIHPDDWEKVERSNLLVMNEGKPTPLEYRILRPEGSERVVWAEAGELERDEHGNPCLLRGIVMDITERKQTEEALRASEQRFRALIEHSHDAITLLAADGTVLYDSPSIGNVLGYDLTERIGHKVFDYVYGDERDRMAFGLAKFAGQMGAVSPSNLRFLHKDGSLRDIEGIRTNLLQDPAVRAIVVNYRDVTERRKTEKGLQESESKFRSIIEASPVPYALNDEQQNITYLNQAFVNTFGYTLEDIPTLAEWWPKAYPDEEYRQWVAITWQEHLNLAVQTGSPFEAMELNIHCKDGTVRTAIVGAAALGEALKGVHLVILYDITERKQVEQLLETERNFATQVMNSMGQGLTVTDEHGRFEYVNTAFAAITGYEPNDLLGMRLEEITSSNDIEILKEANSQRKHGETTTYETRLKHRDGHEVHVMVTGVPRWRSGKVSGTIAVITDLTERNLVEEALRESEAQYRQRVNELQTIMDTIPVVLWVAHDPMCKVLKGNRTAYELHKLPMDSNASFTSPEGQQIIHSKVFHNGVEVAGSDLPLQVCASKGIEILDYEEEIVFDDGKVLYEIGNAKPLFDEAGKPRGAVGAFIDITERKQAENEVTKRAKELDALQKIVLDITASQNLPGLLESIVARACQLVGAPCGAMYLCEPKKQEVNCVVSYNTGSDYTGTILKFGEGVAGKIAQTGMSMNIPNYQTWAGRSQIFEEEKPFTAILGVPLMWGGQVSGVIDLMHFEKGSSFKQEDMEVLNLFAGHAAIAIENTRLLQEAISHNEEVRQLSIRLEEAEENERRRIARELHDQVGQSLSALSINLNIMHSQMPEYLPGFKRRLEDSLMLIDQTTDNIRSLMSELRPAVLDDYGLKAALDWAATAIARRTDLKVEVVGECKRFEPRVEIALFRIAQEALANVSRHAQAKNVKIQLEQNGSDLIMSIADDGIGMGTTLSLESKTGGMGLRLMRERAEGIGGILQIESSHVLGTKIMVKYHDQDPAGR